MSVQSTVPTIASVIGIARQFESLKVHVDSPDSELSARNYLQDVRKATKQLDKDVRALKAPLKTAIDDIDAAVKPWKALLAERDAALEQALLLYGRKVREAAEAAQRKLMEQYEKKVAKVEAKAEATGKPMPIVPPPPIIAAPPKSVQLDAGTQTTVVIRKWRIPGIADPSLITRADIACAAIPDHLFILDTAKITKIIKAGGEIHGVENYTDETISVRGRTTGL